MLMIYPKRVFLIDDDEDDCFIFGTVLNEFEQRIEFFHDDDSEMALRRITDESLPVPDLLFLDWNMPKRSGKQCLMAIKQFPLYADVPVIVYTTSNAQEDREEALRLGASYFLSKPASIVELRNKLLQVFSLAALMKS